MISILTTRLKRLAYHYLGDVFKHQLDNHAMDLKAFISKNQLKTSIASEVNSQAISISELCQLWSCVLSNLKIWNSCDVIIACPETVEGATKLFTSEKVLLVQDFRKWEQTFIAKTPNTYRSFGVVSPSIAKKILDDNVLVSLLTQHVKRNLILITSEANSKEYSDFRCMLHKSGFYEAVTFSQSVTSQSEPDSSTVGIFPDGVFDAQMKNAGLSTDFSGFKTLLASRVAIRDLSNLPWKGVIGCADWDKNLSSSVKSDQFALMVNEQFKSVEFCESFLIEGTAHWDDVNNGHASLVACYSGPDDTNMYAALIEFAGDKSNLALSLWRNSGEWLCLSREPIVVVPVSGKYELTYWLKVSKSQVSVGTEDSLVFSIDDTLIPRTCRFGIRLFGNAFSLTNIKAQGSNT